MKRLMQMGVLVMGLWVLSAGAVSTAEQALSPTAYVTLETPQPTSDPSKIEIVELFSYACPHCFHFEPALNKWVAALPKDVVFVRIPVVFRPSWEALARAYYVANLLGISDKISEPLFKAIHEQKQNLETEDAMAKFFVAQGVEEKQFRDAYNSFSVAADINRGQQMLQRYGVSGVPTLIINGKYRTSAAEAGSQEGMLKVADALIAQERAAHKAAKP